MPELHLTKTMNSIKRIALTITIICQLGLSQALAADANFGILYSQSTISFGNPLPRSPLSNHKLRLLVWNIHKGHDERMPQDFSDLSTEADITLIQEIVSRRSFLNTLVNANPELTWTMAKSFQQFDFSFTGVANGARVRPLREQAMLSDAKEPLANTPKAVLLSEFAVENSEKTLLVANIHSINFVSLDSYRSQIHQLLEKILLHQGPLIVAGDFNTWDPERMKYLRTVFNNFKLRKVATPTKGLLSLDHIFVRGLKPEFVFNLNHVDSSDHAPLMVDLVFDGTEN